MKHHPTHFHSYISAPFLPLINRLVQPGVGGLHIYGAHFIHEHYKYHYHRAQELCQVMNNIS